MGLRYLLLLLAVVGIVLIGRRLLGGARGRAAAASAEVTRMVRCASCGVHVPQSEALRQGEDFFCSRKHLEAARDDAH
jgi:uncharacterized protein